MISTVIFGKGSHYQIGNSIGLNAARYISANVSTFWRTMNTAKHPREWIIGKAREEMTLLTPNFIDEIAGLADGSGQNFDDMLAYNLYAEWVFPEDCTVMMAVGEAGHNGNTLFMKNSDQVGNESMVGPNFEHHKEICLIQVIDPDDGNRIIGVSAAGRTGIKMGVNDKGLATGANIARTIELRERKVDVSQIRARDRTELMRRGLEKDTAISAANLVSGLILENPMSTPGNIEFADSREALIIEGSYTHQAIEIVRDRVAARANRFQLLEYTNQPEDVSSICRYYRCMELLQMNEGKLSLEKFIEFSMDHDNGPGPNSICRHGKHYSEETSLGSASIEINHQAPEKSTIAIALGKPCHAFRNSKGNIRLTVDMDLVDIPSGFMNGNVWKQFYNEDPQLQ